MKKIAVAGLLTALMAGASAQVYVGGTVGVSQLELDCEGATTCDDTGSGSKIYGGYKITPNVSIEAGYINFGKANVKGKGEVVGFVPGYGSLNYSETDSTTKAYVGVAAEYAFTKNFKGVASADFTQTEFDGDSGAVRLFSVGVQYDF